MWGAYFSPLAPAVVLLLSAFLLSIILPRLPAEWLNYRGAHYFIAPGLVGLAIVALFGVWLTRGSTEAELAQLSSWRLATSDAVLGVQADGLSLSFLTPVLLILLITSLINLPLSLTLMKLTTGAVTAKDLRQWQRLSGWLALGAAACFVFVAANALTLSYALMIFEIFLAFYWLQCGRPKFSIARLFLGVLTASALSAAEASSAGAASLSGFLVALTLWLRLGLYPFIEMSEPNQRPIDERLVYLALSLTTGLYLAVRILNEPLPALISGLTIVMLLLNGLLAWLSDDRSTKLVHLILTSSLLVLAVNPFKPNLTAAFSLGFGLIIAIVIAVIILSHFKEKIFARIEMSPAVFSEFISLGWLYPNLNAWLDRAGKLVLGINVIIEGQHYIGWAIFTAIVGILIILLRAS